MSKFEKKRLKEEKKAAKLAKKNGSVSKSEVTLNLNKALSELDGDSISDLFSSERKTVRALCAPDGVNPNPLAYMELNDGGQNYYVCSMYIDKLGEGSEFGLTYAKLFNFPNVTSKVHVRPLDRAEATRMLDKRINGLDSELYLAEKNGDRNRYRKIEQKIQEAEAWAKEVEAGRTALFRVGFLFSLYETDYEKLQESCALFYQRAKESGIDIVATYSIHPEAYMSNAPLADMMSVGVGPFKDCVIKYHIMDKYSLSTIFNHTQADFSHKNGILAGRNLDTFRPILLDPYDKSHDNYNIVVSGNSGVGKSAAVKMWSARWGEVFNYRLAVIDLDSTNGQEGEYVPLVKSRMGVVYQMKHNTENVLNIFELDEESDWNTKLQREERKLYLSAKVDDCTSIVLSMIKNGSETGDFDTDTFLNEIVSTSIMELYTEIGVVEGEPDSLYEEDDMAEGRLFAGKVKKKMPTLSALYIKLLRKQRINKSEFHKKSYALAVSGLEKYVRNIAYTVDTINIVDGAAYDNLPSDENGEKIMSVNSGNERVRRVIGSKPYFDGQSTLTVGSDTTAIDIDLSQLPDRDRDIAQQVASAFINEKFIKRNSCNPNKLQKCLFIIDEFHRMLGFATLKYISSMYRQARKRYVSVMTITQALADYDVNDDTRAMVKNSSMKILFKQDIMDTDFIHQVTPLTEAQILRVTQLGGSKNINNEVDDRRKGELCLIDNNNRVVFMKVDYLVSSESRICETDPSKIAQIAQMRRGA